MSNALDIFGHLDSLVPDRRNGVWRPGMLSARAYSIRQQARLAISLSWIGGYTNVISYLLCDNQFVSHMTGTTTSFGESLAIADWQKVFSFGFLLAAFYFGAVFSAFLTEGAKQLGKRSKYVLPLAFEALLLTAFMLTIKAEDGHIHTPLRLLALTGLAAFAMGLQNATITKISGNVVRTTHLTGVLTDMGLETVQYIFWYWTQHHGRGWARASRLIRLSMRHPTILRLLVLYSIFGSFLFGVVAGTIAFHFYGYLGLVAPVAFLLFIVAIDWLRPIADIKEIDVISDPELKLHGLLHTLLPKELILYRLTNLRPREKTRAPNFQIWIDGLEHHRRVIILVFTPQVVIDDNAVQDLRLAIGKLRARGGQLILGNVTPLQFKALNSHTMIDFIGIENICPDIEFAIAHGAACVREMLKRRSDVYGARASRPL